MVDFIYGNPHDLNELLEIFRVLRSPEGCPWDREQTHESIRENLLEESREVIDAINSGDDINLREELGDLLLQVIFHSQIASERGAFTFDDVVQTLADKLIFRHGHVFGENKASSPEEALKSWNEAKKREKAIKAEKPLA